jgi:predicted DCC family thiol-disulfide oxidoreductase YuxK
MVEMTDMPTPVDRPDADIVIYDGHCRFCRGAVSKLARFDPGGRLAYLSLHDPEVHRRWPDLEHDELMKQMLLVDRHGGRHWGAAAFRYCTRRLPTLWILAPLLHIPFSLPLWQFFYVQFAKRRYLFGKVQSCDSGSCHI